MTASAIPTEKKASLWEDLIDVLFSPARVFERRRGTGFGVPLLVMTVLFTAISAASLPMWRPMLDRQGEQQIQAMRKRGMNDEQIAGAKAMTEKLTPVIAIAGPLIGIPIAILVVSAVLWGVGRLFGVSLTYGDAGVISTFSMAPSIVIGIIGAALLAVLDVETLPTLQAMNVGPALFLGRDASPVITAVATRFGLAELWSLVVTGVGISVIGRVERAKGFLISAALWILGSLFAIAMAMRAAAAMAA